MSWKACWTTPRGFLRRRRRPSAPGTASPSCGGASSRDARPGGPGAGPPRGDRQDRHRPREAGVNIKDIEVLTIREAAGALRLSFATREEKERAKAVLKGAGYRLP